jgi:hypothetical protein
VHQKFFIYRYILFRGYIPVFEMSEMNRFLASEVVSGQTLWDENQMAFMFLEVVNRMPTCQDCRFYTAIDELKGECFNLGFEVRGKTDSKKCPERAFRPNKGPKSRKSGAHGY